jgi:glycosyltransferase involved in cell wall biosynthesis
MNSDSPLVSVVTPVYNGEKYLHDCIESVLAQTYQNWEYVIVNNCSTDRTLEIAQEYADKNKRISVISNDHFVGMTENHNIAFQLISQRSTYCKLVSADDWLYPECIEKLLEVAEHNPTVGIVGSYAINANGIRWIGLPYDTTVFSGRQVCRLYLLGAIDAFGTPSTVLYRSALVRSRCPFFPGSAGSDDLEACLIGLESNDFAFVHQILSFERIHDEAMNTKLRPLNSFMLDRIEFLGKYGPRHLTHDELEERMDELLRDYYKFLAVAAVNLRNNEFWSYHKTRLKQMGYRLRGVRLTGAICMKLLDLLLNPKHTIDKALRRLNSN